jgi:spore coat protein U-like protein
MTRGNPSLIFAAAVLAGVAGWASPAAAASCNVSPSGVSFGAYDPLSSSPLTYNLYTDASRLISWGDGSGGSSTVSMTGAAADIPVYGRMAARQNVPAGAYADTIVVTITY